MANLNDKFDVIKGWEPGGDASVDQSFPVTESGGSPVTLLPGYIVVPDSNGEVDVASSPSNVTLGTAIVPQVYVVLEGNAQDTAAQFVEKVVCLRGKLTVKTDKLDDGQSFPVGGAVTYDNGLLQDMGDSDTTHQVGIVIENNVSDDDTIVVELDL